MPTPAFREFASHYEYDAPKITGDESVAKHVKLFTTSAYCTHHMCVRAVLSVKVTAMIITIKIIKMQCEATFSSSCVRPVAGTG